MTGKPEAPHGDLARLHGLPPDIQIAQDGVNASNASFLWQSGSVGGQSFNLDLELEFPLGLGPLADGLSPNLRICRDILQSLELYLVPLVILVGLVGNGLSFVVFVATHLRRHSCNIYLASLAIADSAFLFGVVISWGNAIGMGAFHVAGWCQMLVYLTYVSSFLSVWYVVAFTLERYVVVCFPLKREQLCSTRTAKVMVGTLAVIALLAYSFALFTSGVTDLGGVAFCAPLHEYFRVVSTLNNIDTLITLVIPTVIIIGCNIRITYVVCSFYKTYRDQVGWNPIQKWDFSHNRFPGSGAGAGAGAAGVIGSGAWGGTGGGAGGGAGGGGGATGGASSKCRYTCVYSSPAGLPSAASRRLLTREPHPPGAGGVGGGGGVLPLSRTAHMRATRMLLIVSTVFLVCNLPSHAVRTYHFIMTMVDPDYQTSPTFLLLQHLFQIIYYINFAVNFFLYSLSGRSFRIGLRRLKIKIRMKWKECNCSHYYYNEASPGRCTRYLSGKTELQIHNLH